MTTSAERADTQASRRSWPLWFWILAPVALLMLVAFCVVGGQRLLQQQQEAAEKKREAAENEARDRAKADDQKYGKEDDAKRFAANFPRSRVANPLGDHLRWPEPQAKLDRETGRWTVTGTLECEETDLESDWEVIVNYTPADGLWHEVSEEPPLEPGFIGWPNGHISDGQRKFHPKVSKDNGAAK